jgi:hypothetical protein
MTGGRILSELETAVAVRKWIDSPGFDPVALTASLNGTLDREIWRIYPGARAWGRAALVAACLPAKAIPSGACRWCVVHAESTVRQTAMPAPTLAARSLLGDMCQGCQGRLSASLDARVNAGRRSMVASAARANAHDLGSEPCAVCHDWRRASRQALTAGGTLQLLPPHRPRPAATGRVSAVIDVHNGQGAHANCPCEECRGSRIQAYRGRRR